MNMTSVVTGTERARLFVDGVTAPITADIADKREDGMVVRQSLPFLRLDTEVTGDDGRRTRIARVRISMSGDVPSLELELEDVTDDDVEAAPAFTPGVSERPPRNDSTVPYAVHCERPSREVVLEGPRESEMPPAPVVTHRLSETDPLADTVPATARAARTITPPRPNAPTLYARVVNAFGRLWQAFFGRPALSLPRF